MIWPEPNHTITEDQKAVRAKGKVDETEEMPKNEEKQSVTLGCKGPIYHQC